MNKVINQQEYLFCNSFTKEDHLKIMQFRQRYSILNNYDENAVLEDLQIEDGLNELRIEMSPRTEFKTEILHQLSLLYKKKSADYFNPS